MWICSRVKGVVVTSAVVLCVTRMGVVVVRRLYGGYGLIKKSYT
jgi:hypothetical protein